MVLGIDVGGTKIMVVKIERNNIIKKWKMGTINGEVLNVLKDLIGTNDEDPVGIGVPCYLRDGICIKAPNISELNGKNLNRLFKNAVIVNDCTAMAYGEYVLRNEKYESLLLVALGTGVGAGFVFRGIPYMGRGSAMEIGHLKGFSEKKCFCGKEGCLETVLGGKYRDIKGMEFKARKGDKEGLKFMKDYGKILARGLAYALQLLDPEIVVIGGSGANAYDLFITSLKDELDSLLSFINVDDIKFEKSKSQESGALGAAFIAERKLA